VGICRTPNPKNTNNITAKVTGTMPVSPNPPDITKIKNPRIKWKGSINTIKAKAKATYVSLKCRVG
jgi:hypothetical protein